MPRFGINFTLKGRVEIDASCEEAALDIFNDKTPSELGPETDDTEITEIEIVEDYRDDEGE